MYIFKILQHTYAYVCIYASFLHILNSIHANLDLLRTWNSLKLILRVKKWKVINLFLSA